MTDYRQIVFLASYPKSGNTWLRCFLDAYFLGDVDINDIVSSAPDDLASRCAVGDGSNAAEFPVDIQMLTRPMAMLRMVREYNRSKQNIPLFVKTHNTHVIANGVEMMPESLTKATVYLVRDPRDVVVSFAKHMGADVETAIGWFLNKYRTLNDANGVKMHDFISSWPLAVQSFANADTHNVKIWRYEDMKSDPVSAFTSILEHSGVVVDRERVKRAADMVEQSKLQQMEKDKGFRESSKYAQDGFFSGTGGWKGKLTPSQLLRIEKACSSMMKRFNYQKAMT